MEIDRNSAVVRMNRKDGKRTPQTDAAAAGNRATHTEEERRRHVEEVRERENAKRQHVECRKRAILAAEKQRRESILRKSLERDTKFELKKRESSSVGFAFGSSTPRLLDNSADSKSSTPNGSSCGRRRSASMSICDSAQRLAANKSTASTSSRQSDQVAQNKITYPSPNKSNTSRSPNFPASRPKRTTNLMSTSLIVSSSFSNYWNTPIKTATAAIRCFKSASKSEQKFVAATSTPTKALPTPSGFSRIPKAISSVASAMTKSAIAAYTPIKAATAAKTNRTNTERKCNNSNQNNKQKEIMSASFIARNKIATEQEAIAALAERRRLKREEAEREAAALAQRNLQAELKRRDEEARLNEQKLLEESVRLAEEEERTAAAMLRKAYEEEKRREELERQRALRQLQAREEAESKARREADILNKLVVAAERLRLEENERKERRKRVEAIMSRMRKAVGSETKNTATCNADRRQEEAEGEREQQQQQLLSNDISKHAKYNVNSTGILIVRESNFNFLRS